jgi:crotonobetainyl-CoA:carnitine CoA-transferase CaiB-like acyl-CoA transferase
MDQVLTGMRVLDLTHYIAGPYCTKLLADYGAEVIKIERRGNGDGARRVGPFYQDIPDPEKSGLFLYLNTSKKGITLNLKSCTGIKIFKKLVGEADLVVENFHPRVMPGLGLDYETLKRINPGLVMTSISNFGQDGPYRDFRMDEIVADAMGGWSYTTGGEDREPLKPGGYQAQITAGAYAAMAGMTALTSRDFAGKGQHVDVSILECVVNMLMSDTALYSYTGEIKRREGKRHKAYPSTVLPCKDGHMAVVGHTPDQWEAFCAWMEKPELLDDPRFETSPSRREHADELDAILMPWLKERTQEELYHGAQELRIPFGKVMDSKQILNHSHLKSRQYFIDIEHPATGRITYPGAPFRFGELPYRVNRAPLLGEHNREIYCGRLGFSREELVQLRQLGVI